MQENHAVLNTPEAAEYMGVSVGTIRRWASAGTLREMWLPGGKQRRFLRSDLDALIAEMRSSTHLVDEAKRAGQLHRAALARAGRAAARAARMGQQ